MIHYGTLISYNKINDSRILGTTGRDSFVP